MASDEHQDLVRRLVNTYRSEGKEILCASISGFSECPKIGRHEPDILARDPNELTHIGEAKVCDDLTNTPSKEQFVDFSNRVMTEGKSKGKALPFILIVPKSCVNEAWKVLRELGLDKKPNVSVHTPTQAQ